MMMINRLGFVLTLAAAGFTLAPLAWAQPALAPLAWAQPALAPLAWAQPAAPPLTENIEIDVKNGDQRGRLMIRSTDLAFESLTDSKHSRTWKYEDVRTLERRAFNGMRVRPQSGSRYDFKFQNKADRERIFTAISDRIYDTRQARK